MYLRCLDLRCAQAAVLMQYRCTLAIFELTHCVFWDAWRELLCIAMLDVRSCVFVTFELTRCVLAMLGLAMCTGGCTTSILLHTRSTCVVSHCILGMLGVRGCVIAMLDVRSCVFAIFELTCVMCARLCSCDVCRQLY